MPKLHDVYETILAEPQEDAHRLLYAKELERKTKKTEWAEFIRVQVRIAELEKMRLRQNNPDHSALCAEHAKLKKREQELFPAVKTQIDVPKDVHLRVRHSIRSTKACMEGVLTRGFVSSFLARGNKSYNQGSSHYKDGFSGRFSSLRQSARFPLEKLRAAGLESKTVEEILSIVQKTGASALHICGCQQELYYGRADKTLQKPSGLTNFYAEGFSATGWAGYLDKPFLGKLEVLGIENTHDGRKDAIPENMSYRIREGASKKLHTMLLKRNRMEDESQYDLRDIVTDKNLQALSVIDLRGNWLHEETGTYLQKEAERMGRTVKI